MDQPRIVLCMPRASAEADFDAVTSFFLPTEPDSPIEVDPKSPCTTALCCTFNTGWAYALHRYEQGLCTHFAMQHDDVRPPPCYLDGLLADLEASGADVLSACVPIKDAKGLSSTAVDDTGDPWHPRRLTLAQLQQLPDVFFDEDVGGPLLLNTGCWIVKLGPWATEENADGTLRFYFDTHNRIYRGPDRRPLVGFMPEDWDASRQFRRLGLKLAASRRLSVGHFGGVDFRSHNVWGWDHDQQNAPGTNVRGEKVGSVNGRARQHDPAVAAVSGPAGR